MPGPYSRLGDRTGKLFDGFAATAARERLKGRTQRQRSTAPSEQRH